LASGTPKATESAASVLRQRDEIVFEILAEFGILAPGASQWSRGGAPFAMSPINPGLR